MFRTIVEFLFPSIQRKRLAMEWNDAVKNEVIVISPKDAKWIVFQADWNTRYVAENLFARNCDIAYPAESIRHDN